MNMSPAGILSPLIAALWAVCSAQVALAGERGSFDLIETHVHDYTTLEHAGWTITAGPLEGTAAVLGSSGAPFAAGEIYRMTCVVYAKKSGADIDLESSCTMTDASGDKVYLLAKRRAGDVAVGGGGQGNQRIVSGTGKYAGVTGECPYTTRHLPDNWLVSRGTCAWHRP